MSFWVAVRKTLRESDIILFVVDARMPLLSMNKEIKEKIEMSGKKCFLVFNKIDLISESKLNALKKDYKEAFFISTTNKMGVKNMRKKIIEFAEKEFGGTIKIGVVGYPNVGKSSTINSLSGRASAKVSNLAGTTKGVQWIRYDNLKFLDSPGVIPFDDKNSKLGILGAKDPEKLKNPIMVAYQILKEFLNEKETLENYYSVELSDDAEEIFNAIGKRRGFLSKGGIVDETKTAISIIRDWQRGKLKKK